MFKFLIIFFLFSIKCIKIKVYKKIQLHYCTNTFFINRKINIYKINKNKFILKNEKNNFFNESYVYHTPVLTDFVIKYLKNESNENTSDNVYKDIKNNINYYIDATLGGSGHTLEILKNIINSKIIGIDKDIEAIYYSKWKLKNLINNRLFCIHGDYKNILFLLNEYSFPLKNYNGILIDLGISTHQLKNNDRGFSYKYDGILDMNMDKYTEKDFLNKMNLIDNFNISNIKSDINDNKNNISNILNNYSLNKLKFIMEKYGEEKKAFKIAKKIIEYRKNKKIKTTFDLKNIVLSTCKNNYKMNMKVLSRVFQSFRIYINDELNALKSLLYASHKLLKINGRLITISYHSLEEKCILNYIKKKKNIWIQINQNAIVPNENEIKLNKSSRSAKMYVFEKIK